MKPPFYVPTFCVSPYFTQFLYGPGQMPIGTMFSGSHIFLDFTPFIGGPHSNIQLECYYVTLCAEMSVA